MTPVSFVSETTTSSVSTTGVYEWPVPATRTVRSSSAQRRTIACSSDSLSGSRIRSGSKETLPDQLVHRSGSLYEIQEKIHGFSRGMNPSLLNQTTLRWQSNSPIIKKYQCYI
jgi:hypothetical protein